MNKYHPTYYQKNKQKMIDASKRSYHNRIASMTPEELIKYRKRQSKYFRQWYEKKCGRTSMKIRKVKEKLVTPVCVEIPKKYVIIDTTETTFTD